MDLKTVIQSKSEREKQIYINVYICRIQKTGTDEPVCKVDRDTDVEKKLMDTNKGKMELR